MDDRADSGAGKSAGATAIGLGRGSRRGSGRPTIADVARCAGVGAITVSRALRDPARVSQDLRDRIAAAVLQLGYVPDQNARALASARADVIGVLVPSLTNIVFADVLRGIYDALGEQPLKVQLANTHYAPEEEERLVGVFLGQRPAALIVAGIDQNPATRRLLQGAQCPVVQIMETAEDPVDMLVGFSHFDGGRVATRHLIEAGYRRIGFVGARMDPRSQRRLAGYRAAMQAAGLDDPALVTTTTRPSSITLGAQLYADARAQAPGLDAVFCNNDDLALGVLFACQHAAVAVPGRFGICGFNDLEMMAAACPALTSVFTPRYQVGQRAVQMIQARLAGAPMAGRAVDLGFTLQARASTARAG